MFEIDTNSKIWSIIIEILLRLHEGGRKRHNINFQTEKLIKPRDYSKYIEKEGEYM